MPLCCSDVFVIKCLSAVAGCHPGRPFQSCSRAGSSRVAGCRAHCGGTEEGAGFWGFPEIPARRWGCSGQCCQSCCCPAACTLLQTQSLFCIAQLWGTALGQAVRTVLWTFKHRKHCPENQTRISQPQAGLGHYILYNHQQLFLCWLGLNLHGRKWKEKD